MNGLLVHGFHSGDFDRNAGRIGFNYVHRYLKILPSHLQG